jgi:hypothetical protein
MPSTPLSTPLSTVKQRFESKEKLVEAVEKLMSDELWVNRLSSDRGGKRGLRHVSNTKLLRLHDTLSAVQKEFGSRDKLVAELLKLESRTEDAGYKRRLEGYSAARLFDQWKSSKRRASRAAKAKAE